MSEKLKVALKLCFFFKIVLLKLFLFFVFQNIHSWDYGLSKLLVKVSELRPLVILIDGIDQLADYSKKDLEWLPRELPPNVRLLVSVRDDSADFSKIKVKILVS